MTLEELITKHQKALGDLDKTILRYVLDNKKEVQQLGITELATATYTSKSTVLRLVRKLGFAGFSEFKYFLKTSTKELNQLQRCLLIYSSQISLKRSRAWNMLNGMI